MNPLSERPWAPDTRGLEPGRAGSAAEEAETLRDSGAEQPRPHLSPQPAVSTRRHGAERAPARSGRIANWVQRPCGRWQPRGSRQSPGSCSIPTAPRGSRAPCYPPRPRGQNPPSAWSLPRPHRGHAASLAPAPEDAYRVRHTDPATHDGGTHGPWEGRSLQAERPGSGPGAARVRSRPERTA